MNTIQKISQENINQYIHLVGQYKNSIDDVLTHDQIDHYGIRVDDSAVGIVFFAVKNDVPEKVLEIFRFYIAPQYRRQGLGRQFFNFIVENILPEDCKSINFNAVFHINEKKHSSRNALTKIIKNCPSITSFEEAHIATWYIVPYSRYIKIKAKSWYKLPLNDAYKLIKWIDLSTEHKKKIRDLEPGIQEKDFLYQSPFFENFEPRSSMVVMANSNESVAGWMMTQEHDPRTITLKRFYIYENFRNKKFGNALALLISSRVIEQGRMFYDRFAMRIFTNNHRMTAITKENFGALYDYKIGEFSLRAKCAL